MVATYTSKSAQIRARLGHPVIDVDGHWQEMTPLVVDYVLDYARQIGGSKVADRVVAAGDLTLDQRLRTWFQRPVEEHRDTWSAIPSWWGIPSHARDRATGHLPRLLHERMDELGIDYSVLYPSQGLGALNIRDPEARPVVCRALNTLHAERPLHVRPGIRDADELPEARDDWRPGEAILFL